MATKRSIRLKEHAGSSGIWSPSDDYLDSTNGSLKKEQFVHRLTDDHFLDTGVKVIPTRRNIFALGDSFVESSYNHEDRRFIAQVARNLDANVLNGGYSGTTTLQVATMLIAKIAAIAKRGDIILLFAPLSDRDAIHSGGYWNPTPRYSTILPPDANSTPEHADDTAAILRTSIYFCRQLGLIPSILITPYLSGDFNKETWLRKRYHRNRDSWLKAINTQERILSAYRSVATSEDVLFLDLSAHMKNQSNYFMDQLHLNNAGQDKAAQLLTNFLEEQFRIPPVVSHQGSDFSAQDAVEQRIE